MELFLSRVYQSEWARVGILIVAGLLSFTYNLHISLMEGTEGLYAQITRELVATQEYFRLTHLGEQYINKPPFYFWMVSGWTQAFGENEITLRMTSVVFALGTMWLTYVLGKTLFSSQVGFWGALIVATNHVFLWYGRRVLIDTTLTFFMTLAILGVVLGNRKGGTSFWYFVAWIGMILASMVKGLHGFALPLLLIITYSIWQKDFRIFKSLWFWFGIASYFAVMNQLYYLLDPSFQWHFNWQAGLTRAFNFTNNANKSGSFKFYWYLYMLWFDFFPWSLLIPVSLMFLLSKRPFRQYSGEHLIGLWFLGFLLIMCLSQFRREPYLMPLVPPLGLIIGYYLTELFSTAHIPAWHRKLNIAAFGVLTGFFLLGFWGGPFLLNRKWHVPLDLFPIVYVLIMLTLCGTLIWATWKEKKPVMFTTLIGVALGFTLGIVQFLLPAINQASSPKYVASQVRALAARNSTPIYYYGITKEDFSFYLNGTPAIPRIKTQKELIALAHHERILLVTDKEDAETLSQRNDLTIKTLEEYPQPRERNFLVLLIDKNHASTNKIGAVVDKLQIAPLF